MNMLTHAHIANRVYKRLKAELGVNLSRKDLVWGSVRPDLIKKSIPHFKNQGMKGFYQKGERFLKYISYYDIDYFSRELGEVFHYLCDYFCYAHNSPDLIGESWKHFKYESKLHKKVLSLEDNFYNNIKVIDLNQLSYIELIENKHQEFIANPPSFENDLISSFEICAIVGKKFIKVYDPAFSLIS